MYALFATVQVQERPERPRSAPKCTGDKKAISEKFRASVKFYHRGYGHMWSIEVPVYDLIYDQKKMSELEDQYISELKKQDQGDSNLSECERANIWKWVHFPATNMTWVRDFTWFLTVNHEDKESTWLFLQQNILARKQEGVAGCTRMPHVRDSRKYERPHEKRRHLTTQSRDSLSHLPTISENPAVTQKGSSYSPQKKKDSVSDILYESSNKSTQTEASKNTSQIDGWRGTLSTFPKHRKLSIVFPYIDFETEHFIYRDAPDPPSERRKEFEKRGFIRNQELDKAYAPYKGSAGLQGVQTLDESYYWMLGRDAMRDRDVDQVVYKWWVERLRTRSEGTSKSSGSLKKKEPRVDVASTSPSTPTGPVIYVTAPRGGQPRSSSPSNNYESTNQMNHSLLEVHSKRRESSQHSRRKKVSDLASPVPMLLTIHQMWIWKMDERTVITASPERWHSGSEDSLLDTIRQQGVKHFKNPEQLIAHILHECAKFIERYKYAGFGDHILDVFEQQIARLSDQESTCFKLFKDSLSGTIPNSVNKEIELLYEVKDIHDELQLLHRIFESQREVLVDFSNLFWHGQHAEAIRDARALFIEDSKICSTMKRVNRLDEDTQRTHTSTDFLIQTKQAQSSLQEAEAAGKLNNYIMIFTIVTIVFTPLAWLTSLFATPLDIFEPDPEKEIRIQTTWFIGRMVAGELGSLAGMLLCIGLFFAFTHRKRLLESMQTRGNLPQLQSGLPFLNPRQQQDGDSGESTRRKSLRGKSRTFYGQEEV